jgi:hypothetical protein
MKYPSVQVVRTNLNLGFNGRYFYVLRTGPSCYGLRSTREYKTYEGAQKAGERTITRLRKVLQQEEIK